MTWPRLTSVAKSENARVDCGPRVDDAWKIAYKQVTLLEMDGVLPPMNFII